MKVEIINHDNLSVDTVMEVVPRIGEIVSCTTRDGDYFSGTVRDVEHSYHEGANIHSVIVFLKP